LRDLLIVHPAHKKWDVIFCWWTKVEFPALEKYYATIVFGMLFHVIILSKSKFAGTAAEAKNENLGFRPAEVV
jgi:hypothetical protein